MPGPSDIKHSGVEWPAIFSLSLPFSIFQSLCDSPLSSTSLRASRYSIFALSSFPCPFSPASAHDNIPLTATMATPSSYPPNNPLTEYPPPSLAVVELSNWTHMVFTVDHVGDLTSASYFQGNCVTRHGRVAVGKPFSPLAVFNTWRGLSGTGTVADHVHLYFVGHDQLLKELCFEPAVNRWTSGDLSTQYPLLGGATCCGIAAVFEKNLTPNFLPEMHVFFQLNDGTIQQYRAQLGITHLTGACRYFTSLSATTRDAGTLTATNKSEPFRVSLAQR